MISVVRELTFGFMANRRILAINHGDESFYTFL